MEGFHFQESWLQCNYGTTSTVPPVLTKINITPAPSGTRTSAGRIIYGIDCPRGTYARPLCCTSTRAGIYQPETGRGILSWLTLNYCSISSHRSLSYAPTVGSKNGRETLAFAPISLTSGQGKFQNGKPETISPRFVLDTVYS